MDETKVTMRLPSLLVKEMKHRAIDKDINVTRMVIHACYEYLDKEKKNLT